MINKYNLPPLSNPPVELLYWHDSEEKLEKYVREQQVRAIESLIKEQGFTWREPN